MPLYHRNEVSFPPRKTRYPPRFVASLRRDGELGRGGSFSFRPPLVFFSPYSILLGGVCNHCVQLHKRGIGALCAVFRRHIGLPAPPRKEPAWAASGGLRYGKKNEGANARKRGAFCTASPVRPRERSPSRVVEPCCRRARESAAVPAANETNAEQKRNL